MYIYTLEKDYKSRFEGGDSDIIRTSVTIILMRHTVTIFYYYPSSLLSSKINGGDIINSRIICYRIILSMKITTLRNPIKNPLK